MSHGRRIADQVFILRFWREEPGCEHEARWRVQVRNVNTRERQVVDDPQSAFNIVLTRLETVTTVESSSAI
jgi:hypothetical protein